MSTLSQIAANIANKQQSTGPRTEAGKAVSSQNALKHGLTAQTVLLPGDDEAAYRKMCEGYFADHQPETTSERELVQFLCDLCALHLFACATRTDCYQSRLPWEGDRTSNRVQS